MKSVSISKFYEAEYIIRAIKSILRDQFAYLRNLDGFYGDVQILAFLEPFQEYSSLHRFIGFVANSIIYDEGIRKIFSDNQGGIVFSEDGELINDGESISLPINEAFDFYQIEHIGFAEWFRDKEESLLRSVNENDIDGYLEELTLTGEFEGLIDTVIENIFPILFADQETLEIFNEMIARQINRIELDAINDEYAEFFSESGVLKKQPIPDWVKERLILRDKGCCAICKTKIGNNLALIHPDHFCFIVPLKDSGLNDLTNIRILCEKCVLEMDKVDPSQQTLW